MSSGWTALFSTKHCNNKGKTTMTDNNNIEQVKTELESAIESFKSALANGPSKERIAEAKDAVKSAGAVVAEKAKTFLLSGGDVKALDVYKEEIGRPVAQYLSRAVKVHKAITNGLIMDNGQTVTTLYDIALKAEKAAEEKAAKMQAINLQNAAAILAHCDGDQDAADAIMTAGGAAYVDALVNGNRIIAEKQKADAIAALAKDNGEKVTMVKTFVDGLFVDAPELWQEIYDHMTNALAALQREVIQAPAQAEQGARGKRRKA